MTDTDRFEPLRRRFLSLGLGEIAAAVVFAVVPTALPFITSDGAESALWFALSPLLFVLVQGGVYWLIARNSLPGPIPRAVAHLYRGLRILDPIVLVGSAIGIAVTWPGPSVSAFVVVVVWLFAVAEYVNYFHIRLSYPWAVWAGQVGRWSTPRLLRDLRRA
ncbi:hypothetical protein [Brevibacterium spongiae]|uniref:Uncharacterized protein n=1 Tax=Brevibacterium spongiae TaxID=2909672 RepID=A0ABY5SNI2_9MICO|nr:hypothetical protein [Brevibacterium spongiae]UVI35690.1 hypothetical protein L1F31_16470 [Brevibacterium spongiae]